MSKTWHRNIAEEINLLPVLRPPFPSTGYEWPPLHLLKLQAKHFFVKQLALFSYKCKSLRQLQLKVHVLKTFWRKFVISELSKGQDLSAGNVFLLIHNVQKDVVLKTACKKKTCDSCYVTLCHLDIHNECYEWAFSRKKIVPLVGDIRDVQKIK